MLNSLTIILTNNTDIMSRSHCLCDDAFRICLQKATKLDEMASVVGELFFNIIKPSCLARPIPRSPRPNGSRQPNQIGGPSGTGRPDGNISPLPLRESEQDMYRPRLDCLAIDDNNGCRLWASNPKSVPLKLKIIRPNFNFQVP